MDELQWGEVGKRVAECCRPEPDIMLHVTDLPGVFAWVVFDQRRGLTVARGTSGTSEDARFEAAESYQAYRAARQARREG